MNCERTGYRRCDHERHFTEPRFVGVARSDGVDSPPSAAPRCPQSSTRPPRAQCHEHRRRRSARRRFAGRCWQTSSRGKLDGRLEVASPNAADLLSALPESARLQGPLVGDRHARRNRRCARIVAEVSGKDLTLPEQPIAPYPRRHGLSTMAIDVERFTARQAAGGELVAIGPLRLGRANVTHADLDGQNLDLARHAGPARRRRSARRAEVRRSWAHRSAPWRRRHRVCRHWRRGRRA